jgi:tetratricopeptide (TPR) repeat protein
MSGIDRYRLEAELGSGAMGAVYRAYDRERDARVALKLLRDLDPETLYRFKQEFRALTDVSHHNLVSLYELVASDRDTWFLTMELVDGVDFLEYVRGPEASQIAGLDEPGPRDFADFDDLPSISQGTDFGTGAHDFEDVLPTTQIPTFVAADALGRQSPVPIPPLPRDQPRPLAREAQLTRLRAALRQLAEAVDALHRAGILHRDLKPSNVLVTAEGRVVVLDFGIVLPLRGAEHKRESRERMAGTPAYMAPEQGTGAPLTAASDWYSVGIVLYEALTGRVPFSGKLHEVMEKKRCLDPPPPMLFGEAVPADLDALCMDLLARAPEQRPSATEVLARLGGARSSAPRLSPDAAGTDLLVGRARQLAVLENTFLHTARGQLGAVLVRGRSGVGKSALVQRFTSDLAATGAATVLAGRCYEREQVPFKALDSLMDAFTRLMLDLPAAAGATLLPPRIEVLARMFPVLRQIEAVAAMADASGANTVLDQSSPREQRRLAVEVLRALLARLSAQRPVVLAVDDVQWGDTDSASLLADAVVPAAKMPVLLIFSCRTDTAALGGFIDSLSTVRLTRRTTGRGRNAGGWPGGWPGRWVDVPLEQLALADARALATALLERAGVTTAQAEVVAQESGGNPLFVHELVHYLSEHADARTAEALSLTLEQVLRARLAELPGPARALLEAVAVAGRPLDEDVAFRAAGLTWDDQSALAYLRNAHLVRTLRADGRDRIETAHDRIRATVLSELARSSGQRSVARPETAAARAATAEATGSEAVTSSALAECHRRLADALLAAGETDAEILGWHYECAGERARAAEHYHRAARRAARALAFDRAAALFERTARLGEWPDDARRQLEIQRAEALTHAGRSADAAQAYLRAAEGADSDSGLRLRGRAADQLLRSGHVDAGLETLRQVLGALGLRLPQSRIGTLSQLLRWRLQVRLRGFERRGDPGSELSPALRTRLDLCWTATACLAMVDVQAGMAFQQRHAIEALAAGDPGHVARALAAEAAFVSLAGISQRVRAMSLCEEAQILAQDSGDRVALAWAHGVTGLVHFMSGEWVACSEAAERSLPLLTDHDAMRWERSSAELYRLWGLQRQGALARIAERTLALRFDAEERGDLYSMALFSTGWPNVTWLMTGDVEGARAVADEVMARWSQRTYQLEHYWYLLSSVNAGIYAGEGAHALALIDRDREQVRRSLLLRTQIARIEFADFEGRAALCAAVNSRGEERGRHLARAERCRRRLAREDLATAHASAALIAAAIAAVQASDPADERVLAQMRAAAQACDVAAEPLRAAVIRGYLGQRLGGDAGANLMHAAEERLLGEGVTEPARMSAMLVPGFTSGPSDRASR